MTTLLARRLPPLASRAGGAFAAYPTSARLVAQQQPRAAAFSSFAARLAPASPDKPKEDKLSESINHSFQPHPFDEAPEGVTAQEWKNSRPWSDWVLSHPVYNDKELEAVKVVRLPPKTISDKFANLLVQVSRKGFDFVTGYKHASPEEARKAMVAAGKENASLEDLRKAGYVMDVPQWMARILFLESIAGIPGMVGGILRHLQSLRLMKRDGGWINTLLQEAENERMHLMTFMKIRDAGWFFRLIVLGAQGVYFNAFFLLYLMSPKAAHRFVGYLEEEAVVTYTQIVDEIRRGNIPEWGDGPEAQPVPNIALDYWRLPKEATMIDLVLAVRADEAGHRFVNHSLANLDPKKDFNPFGMKHATPEMQGTLPGVSREEGLEWAKKVEDEFKAAQGSKKADA
ncbi:alternative oxidase [Pseudohyphozyma bogoriensis]|nr:alternative oxidase [Pseudohyphozyma bogoriensis]